MQPNLEPPSGMWRGSTWNNSARLNWDPQNFEEEVGVPLHIFRNFPRKPYTIEPAREFVERGGIVFYSIQHNDWKKASDSNNDA